MNLLGPLERGKLPMAIDIYKPGSTDQVRTGTCPRQLFDKHVVLSEQAPTKQVPYALLIP